MSAKEMFEELGYRLYPSSHYMGEVVYYEELEMNSVYLQTFIAFNNKNKEVCKYFEIWRNKFGTSINRNSKDINTIEPMETTLEELQAINKQVEELGWNI